ncbi:MAG: BamA/TamA family outer membrane protein, partial [Pseudomonadales bacterium]|nr:BamA/TamA family outer membrane protein [Pseudomonadales bacterium]
YRYRFADEWKIATFIDTGRAYISTSEPFSTGAGIGLRWEMPVGMIAFDVAAPVDNATAKATRIHIYMSTLL